MANEIKTAPIEATPTKDFNRINVTLTFEDFEPMKLTFRRQLSQELKNAKQDFLGLTKEEQEKEQQRHKAFMLGQLLLERPIGIPNYGSDHLKTFTEQFDEHFTQPENEELLDWVNTLYQAKLYPKELLS